jgi:hypothetical protein
VRTTEHTEHKGDKTFETLHNYYEGIRYEGQTFGESGIFTVSELHKIQLLILYLDDLYNNDAFVKAAEEAVAQNMAEAATKAKANTKARKEKGYIVAPRISTVKTSIQKATTTIEAETNPKISVEKTSYEAMVMRRRLIQSANQELTSPSSTERSSVSKPPSPPKVRDFANETQSIRCIPYPSAYTERFGGNFNIRRVEFPFPLSTCVTCGYSHLRVTRTCPQNASELELRLMSDAVDAMPPTQEHIAYRTFLQDQLIDRAARKKNTKA